MFSDCCQLIFSTFSVELQNYLKVSLWQRNAQLNLYEKMRLKYYKKRDFYTYLDRND